MAIFATVVTGILTMLVLSTQYLPSSVRSTSPPPYDLLINEVDYDQPSTDQKEFIEIVNTSPDTVTLGEYSIRLVDVKGIPYHQFPLSNVQLPPGAYYVVCSSNSAHVTPCNQSQLADSTQPDRSINLLRNGAGNSIALIKGAAALITDSLTYGDSSYTPNEYTEGEPSVTDSASKLGYGISRCPDSNTTLNNFIDFTYLSTTPGAPNDCAHATPSPTHPPNPPHPPPAPPSPPSPPAGSFPFFFLVNQWPGSWSQEFCTDKANPWTPPGPMWTIHGLWPNFAQPNSYPTFCDPNYPFDGSELSGQLRADMGLYWPSFSCAAADRNNYFWEHEWEKHGTCAEALLGGGDRNASLEAKYFNVTVEELRKKRVDIYSILREADITPGGSYPAAQIQSAVSKGLNVDRVFLKCSAQKITEIWVCVSPAFEIISCESSWLASSSCGSSTFYPLCGASGAPC